MSFEQDRQETGETPMMRPWGGSGFGTEMVRDKTGPRFVGGKFTTEPRRPFISNYYRNGYSSQNFNFRFRLQTGSGHFHKPEVQLIIRIKIRQEHKIECTLQLSHHKG